MKLLNIIKMSGNGIVLQFKKLWAILRKQKVDSLVINYIVNTKIKIAISELLYKGIKTKEFQNAKNKSIGITKKIDPTIKKIINVYIFNKYNKSTQLRKIFNNIIDNNPDNDRYAVERIVQLCIELVGKTLADKKLVVNNDID